MKREQRDYKVELIGEIDLSKLTADELELLVSAYIDDLKDWLSLPDSEQ